MCIRLPKLGGEWCLFHAYLVEHKEYMYIT